MSERICQRCRRVMFSNEEEETHSCFDREDLINAEIALCNWDGKLRFPQRPNPDA